MFLFTSSVQFFLNTNKDIRNVPIKSKITRRMIINTNKPITLQEYTPTKDELCAIIVYGIVPELMPHRAFRREKHYKTSQTKQIKCPYCGGLFQVVEATAKLELVRYPKKDRDKVPWDKSMLCSKCKNMVGIIYQAA